MTVIAVTTCECGREDCEYAFPVILCLSSETKEDIDMLRNCISDGEYSIDKLHLPWNLAAKFWIDIETEARIFKSGRDLMNSLDNRR